MRSLSRFFLSLLLSAPFFAAAAEPPTPAARDVEFVYSNPAANKVFLAGDFNGWNTTANPMTKNDHGDWQTHMALEPGRHPYKFVADGKWTQDPANQLQTDDLFGGHNSLLIVNPSPNDDGPVNRRAIVRPIRRLFLARDFGALEKVADELRSSKKRLPEGRWVLPLFYDGVIEPDSKSADAKLWDTYFATLDEWHKQFPQSITEPVVRARALTDYAWQARGSGWSSEVHEKDWHPFEQRLAQARQTLEEAAKLPSRCPEWFSIMQIVALGESWSRSEEKGLFEEAVKKEPTYYDYYFDHAYFLLPRWNGEPGEWEQFSETAGALYDKKEEHALPARIAWSKSNFYGNLFRESNVSWPKMREGFEELIKEWPSSYWNKNNFAYFACMAGDHATANDLFKQIGDGFDYSLWHNRWQFLAAQRWARLDDKSPSVRPLNRFPGRNATRPSSVSYSAKAQSFVAAYEDGALLEWHPGSPKEVRPLKKFDKAILELTASPDGKLIACATGEWHGKPGDLIVVDKDGDTKATIPRWAVVPCGLAWSSDSSTLVAVGGRRRDIGEVRIWNASTGAVTVLNWPPPTHLFIAVALSPDGHLLMTSDGNNIRVWNLPDSKMVFQMDHDTPEPVSGVAFSPDGQHAVAVCSAEAWESDDPGMLLVWKTSDWSEERRLKLDCGAHRVAWSPDGRYVAATRRDNSITLWRTKDWSIATEFLPMAGMIPGIAFSPNEPTLAAATYSDGLSLWQLPRD